MLTKWHVFTNWQRGMPRVGRAAAVLIAGTLLLAAGTQARAAGLLIADGGSGGVLEIDEHTVHVTINNGIAVTEVTQVFHNTENRQVEALYLFPVPKGASVANFSMWIGGKEMIGEVVEKQRAREIYDSYKRVRRDPGLLEQVDYKNFEMRIFPIAPQAQQKVQITYYQELDFDHDWATYVYPLATAPRPGLSAKTKGKFGLSLHVKSEVPIVGLESPSHKDQFVVVKHADNYREASLETTGGDLNRDRRVGLPRFAAAHGHRRRHLQARARRRLFPADDDRRQGTRSGPARNGLRLRARHFGQHDERQQTAVVAGFDRRLRPRAGNGRSLRADHLQRRAGSLVQGAAARKQGIADQGRRVPAGPARRGVARCCGRRFRPPTATEIPIAR